ncbi:hypothetical protein EVG20_g4328 [Dentipellis fragilis]|uniref:Alcohol dehydrogenase iron-type/glycerol dehydrogenase GldA domain-containing protein n=1 Tax=Dentipellis fragilis TaxID=205917 RepID=A0A4Y9Z055_9AGAM|nr:hypothetical protein EVG20_g4328 [Dentipellis fragilis]
MPNPKGVTEKVFQSPSKYIQGPSAIKNAGKYLAEYGRAPLLLADDIVFNIAGKELTAALEQSSFTVTRGVFGGEATREEIQRLNTLVTEKKCDFIIALGGGKTIDTAKAFADDLNLPVAVLPTTASTDAPCSALSVLYRANGEFESYRFFSKNPAIVLVDTAVAAHAPARFLASGIGDALATNIEARAVRNSPNFGGGLPTEVSAAICEKCEEILFKYGRQAVEANRAHAVTPALEAVVEANTLLSGLGFESGGLAAAHALILDGAPTAALDRYLELLHSVGLPITLEELGIAGASDADLRRVAGLACAPNETIWNLDRIITEEIVFNAIKGADVAGRDYLKRAGETK